MPACLLYGRCNRLPAGCACSCRPTLHRPGEPSERCPHAVGAVPFEKHAGVVGQRRFAQQEFVALPGVDKHRQDGHRIARFPPVGLDEAVRLFISGLETARLLHHCGVVIREADGHLFGKHLDVVPEGGDEAVCHAVVVGTEFHGPATPEVEAEHVGTGRGSLRT